MENTYERRRQFSQPNIPGEINEETYEEVEPLREFQKLAMELLSTYGLLEQQDGKTLVDVERLTTLRESFLGVNNYNYRYFDNNDTDTEPNIKSAVSVGVKNIIKQFPDMYKSQNGKTSLYSFLARTFHDIQVVDKREYDQWAESRQGEEPRPKNLFYEPKNEREAFDVAAIKKAQFHIGPWEIIGNKGEEYSPFLPGVSYEEGVLACMVYNSAYGDGERDERGRLMVKNSAGQRQKITLNWFDDQQIWGISNGRVKKNTFLRSPKLYLQEGKLPHLTEKGLLVPEDFHALSGSDVSKKYGQEKRINSATGAVTIGGVVYNLGRQFGTGEYIAYKISDGVAGISKVDKAGGASKLLYTFDLISPKDPRVKPGKIPYYGKRDGLVVREYQDTETGRMAGVGEHPLFLQIKKEIVRKTGLSMEQMTPREQTALLSFYSSADAMKKERLITFIQRYKQIGLRSFLALQYDTNAGEKIFAIDDTFETAEAALILRSYAELMRAAEHVDEEMQKALGEEVGGAKETNVRASQEIVKRADGFVSQFAKVQSGSIDPQEVLDRIRRFNTELSVFSAMFKSEFKGKPVDLHEVAALDYESKNGSALSNSEKQEMIRIAHENYPDEPVAEELENFLYPRSLAGIQALNNNEFVFLKKNKKAGAKEKDIVSFLRVEERGRDRVYVGALNVNPTARGSGLGEHMIAQTLQDLHRDKDIEAVAVPELVAGTHYVEQVGFEGRRFVDAHEAHGTKHGWFEMEYPREATPSELRSKKPSELLNLYTQLFAGGDPLRHVDKPFILARFDTATQMDEVTRVSAALLNEHGYRLTKYLTLDSSGTNRLYGFEKVESPISRPVSSVPRQNEISTYGSAPQLHA